MSDARPRPALVVVGRTDFRTGIGSVTAAACELFARRFAVGFWSPREPWLAEGQEIVLPSGRHVPVVRPDGAAVTFYTDVLWNGYEDYNVASVPRDGLRIAHMAYDSDVLLDEWVNILNTRFDLALFSSEYLVEAARRSGVTIPAGTLPIGLDLEPLLARRFRPAVPTKTRFGTVSAYHTRKGLDLMVEGFVRSFGADPSVELVIHSNLEIGNTLARVTALAAEAPARNVRLSTGDLSDHDKNELIDSFDVYVNTSAGEGYSIGPREALALGKPLVLSAIPAHKDLLGVPGVFSVEPFANRPAVYPEIGNRSAGNQAILRPEDIVPQLEAARAFVQSPESAATARDRRRRAAEFSYGSLAAVYAEVVDPEARAVRPSRRRSGFAKLPPEAPMIARAATGRHGRRLGAGKRVIELHDGGYFSIFNRFLSHLVWGLEEDDVSMVVPDWDAGRLITRMAGEPITSYCYSRPNDGNMWLALFEPVYDLSAEELDSEEWLADGATGARTLWNEDREPNLTYVNAYNLYHQRDYQQIRRQYHSVLKEHIRLREPLQREIDSTVSSVFADRFTVGVHVKHPSHAIEQPGQRLADRHAYVERVRQELRESGVSESDPDWGVFVATDQQRVVELFAEEFGEHVIRFDDVKRISTETDERFDRLSATEKLTEGHQLQHQMAADTSSWSTRLAWEVWRDAAMMAACSSLIHSVSNVSTAVGFLNPEVKMRYFDV